MTRQVDFWHAARHIACVANLQLFDEFSTPSRVIRFARGCPGVINDLTAQRRDRTRRKGSPSMATVFDVAAYILEQRGPMTAMKLQKLVYYSQAWSLVWDEEPLFDEPIEAWANGPVVPRLYDEHRGMFKVSPGTISGRARRLTSNQRDTVDKVLAYYGKKPSAWLSDLTHMEQPWRDVRGDLPPGAHSHEVITHAAMAEYYGGLTPNGRKGRR